MFGNLKKLQIQDRNVLYAYQKVKDQQQAHSRLIIIIMTCFLKIMTVTKCITMFLFFQNCSHFLPNIATQYKINNQKKME